MVSKDILSANIRALRKAHNHTQEQLGALLHVDKMTVSGWETGKKEPGFDRLDAIAEIYGVSVSDLFAFETKTIFPAIAKKQSEVFQCICALASSGFVKNAYLHTISADDEDGWTHEFEKVIAFELLSDNHHIVDPQLLARCTAALSLATAYKTGAMTDAIFTSAVQGVVSDIMEKEQYSQHAADIDDDELPF